jgi:hypothetical protein
MYKINLSVIISRRKVREVTMKRTSMQVVHLLILKGTIQIYLNSLEMSNMCLFKIIF